MRGVSPKRPDLLCRDGARLRRELRDGGEWAANDWFVAARSALGWREDSDTVQMVASCSMNRQCPSSPPVYVEYPLVLFMWSKMMREMRPTPCS